MKKIIVVLVLIIFSYRFISAQELKDRINISGSIFAEYFYNIDNEIDSLKDVNGFQLRRIFFTTDFIISDTFDGRFRLETNQTPTTQTASGRYGVMVKDAFLRWKNIFNGSDLIFGLSPTPILEISEFWGYRALEKSPTDWLNIIPFRDLGVDLKGKLTDDGRFNYHIKIGNNSNNAPEINKYKRYYALVSYKDPSGLQLGLYGDYASMPNKYDKFENNSKNNDQFICSIFLIYSNPDNYALGANLFNRIIRNNYFINSFSPLENQNGLGYSAWAWYKLSDKFRIVGRIDRFDYNMDFDNDEILMVVAGLDYRPANKVSIIPNFELMDKLGKKNKDFTARVTFSFQF